MELLDLISIVLEDENEPIDAPAFVGPVGRAMKITEAQRSLVRLLRVCDPRYIDRATVRRNGLTADFERVRRAGLIRSAGYETSGEGRKRGGQGKRESVRVHPGGCLLIKKKTRH